MIGGAISEEKCTELRDQLGLEALLVTRGNKGMLLFEQGRPALELPAVGPTEPVDVTGAGDTVIAVFTLARNGLSYAEA